MVFRSLIALSFILSLTTEAAQKEPSCWELVVITPQNKAATHEFIRLAKLAEDLFGARLFDYQTKKSTGKLSSIQKDVLLEWLNGIENFGPGQEHSFETLAAATSRLPRVKGIFFSKSPSFFTEVILERDLKEGDVVTVPDEAGFSASKLTPDAPIPFFASEGRGADPRLFINGTCIYVFGEAADFESIYPHQTKFGDKNPENEVNFQPGSKFEVLKVIFHNDESSGTFFLKQL